MKKMMRLIFLDDECLEMVVKVVSIWFCLMLKGSKKNKKKQTFARVV